MNEELCKHTRQAGGHGDGKQHFFNWESCSTCGAQWQIVMARRGRKSACIYNGQLVATEQEWQALMKEGPKGNAQHIGEHFLATMSRMCAQQAELCPEVLGIKKAQPQTALIKAQL